MDPAWRQGTRMAFRLAVTHHPICGWFEAHSFRVAGISVCKGCALVLPAFAAGLALFFPLASAAPGPWLAAGLALGVPHLVTYLVRPTGSFVVAGKVLGGLGLGVVFAAGARMPLPFAAKVAALVAMEAAFLALQVVRWQAMRRVCSACPWKSDWAVCPGFNP